MTVAELSILQLYGLMMLALLNFALVVFFIRILGPKPKPAAVFQTFAIGAGAVLFPILLVAFTVRP